MTADTNDAVAPDPPRPTGPADRGSATNRRPGVGRGRSRAVRSPTSTRCNASVTTCSTRPGACRPTSRTTASACCASRPRWWSGRPKGCSSSCSRCSTASSSRCANLEAATSTTKRAQGNRARVRGVVSVYSSGPASSASTRSGAPFDPNEHEAVMQDDGDGEPHVGDVLRTGWKLKGRVLRPAMVKVTRKTHVWQHSESGSRRTTTPCSACRRARPTRSCRAPTRSSPSSTTPTRTRGTPQSEERFKESQRRLRRARRRRQAQGVRRGAPDGRVRRRSRRRRRRRARRLRRRRAGRPVRRRLRPGPAAAASRRHLLGNLFGEPRWRRRRRRAATGRSAASDLETELHLSFDDAVRGVTSTVRFRADATCSTCHGFGRGAGHDRRETCPECHGSGSIADDQGPFSFSQVCPTCGGRGQVIPTPCPTCRGPRRRDARARGEGARARRASPTGSASG